jgi:sporulation-control protein
MVFKRLLGSLGVGGPAVDTVLAPGTVLPGGELTGEVRLEGGSTDAVVDHITLELVARVEAETADGEHEGTVAFGRFPVGGGFRLAAEEHRTVPFTVNLPWETPVSTLHGQPLGVVLGVRTELGVSGARDKGDLDTLTVAPLPAQEAVLEAFGQLGFGFASADLEYGHIRGTGQQLPFYQEIELTPSPRYADAVNEVEVTFLVRPGAMEVVLEADRRAGPVRDGHDALTCFTVGLDDVAGTDWNTLVDGWVGALVDSRHVPHGHADAAHDHESGHRSGPGVGTAVAVGAAGLAVGAAGGMVAAEVVDEIGDAFEDEEEGEDG